MIAALYVQRGGCYYELPNVDPWDDERDARLYAGPHPVIAHPPCQRWGRYWSGGPSANVKRLKGDDGGCFDRALWAVRTFGGVLEHPEASHAWKWFGLNRPEPGTWIAADDFGGWTCQVEQGHYGHPARKKTWLYAVTAYGLPELPWGPSEGRRLDEGFHSKAERDAARAAGQKPIKRLSTQQNLATPPAFRDLLIQIAESANA